jgi:Protein of unknown function (DUF998)
VALAGTPKSSKIRRHSKRFLSVSGAMVSRHYPTKMPIRAWTQISAAGLLIFVAIAATQGIVAPGFDPVRQAISEYAHSSAGAAIVVGFLAWSVSLLALAALTFTITQSRGEADRLTHLQTGALLSAAVGIALLAPFPTDRGAEVPAVVTHVTVAGQVHDTASAMATIGLFVAALTGAVRNGGSIRVLTLTLVAIGVASSVAQLAVGDPLPGIRQRVLVAAGCLWQAAWLLELRAKAANTSPRSSAGSRCSTS